MNIFQLKEFFTLDADSGSFLFSVVIAVMFYYKYRELEKEAAERDLMENFLK